MVNAEAIARDIQAFICERDRLRAENAALWAFVKADDLWTLLDQSRSDPQDWSPDSEWLQACDAREAARSVLRNYQDRGDR